MNTPRSKLAVLNNTHPILTYEWEFREDCELAHIVDVLAHAMHKQECVMVGPTTGNETYRNIQYLEKLKDDPEYSSLFIRLDSLANKLYLATLQQINTLKNELADRIDTIAKAIRKERDDILVKSGIDSLVGEEYKPIPLNKMKWESIDSVGGSTYIFHKLQEYTNVPIDKVTTATLRYISAKWKPSLTITPKFDTKYFDTIYSIVNKQVNIDRNTFNNLMNYFIDNTSYRTLVSLTRRKWNDAHAMNTIHEFNTLVQQLHAIYAAVSSTVTDVMSNTLMSEFEKNLQALHLLYLSMAAYIHYYRTSVYNNSIILDENTVNADVFEEVEDGTTDVTEEDIMKYIRVHHTLKKVNIPNSGISLKEISHHKEYTNKKLEEHTKNLRTKIKTIRGQATATAMNKVLNEVITNRFTSIDEAKVYRGMLPKYLSMVQEEQNTIEDVLYQYYIDTDYKDTQIGTVYTYYKSNIADKVATESNDIEFNSNIQNDIEQNIIIQLSIDFLKSLIK